MYGMKRAFTPLQTIQKKQRAMRFVTGFTPLEIKKNRASNKVSLTGFTLVEAILTIAIMGILAMVVLPHFVKEGFLGGLRLRSTTSQIASDIRYTRQLAITNSGHYLIQFDFNQREYRIYKDSALPANQIGETKKIPQETNCSGTSQFDFYSLGNGQFSGTGLLISEGTNQNRILVEIPTGVVVIEKIS